MTPHLTSPSTSQVYHYGVDTRNAEHYNAVMLCTQLHLMIYIESIVTYISYQLRKAKGST